jgi:hypothetical protein
LLAAGSEGKSFQRAIVPRILRRCTVLSDHVENRRRLVRICGCAGRKVLLVCRLTVHEYLSVPNQDGLARQCHDPLDRAILEPRVPEHNQFVPAWLAT